jgi:hypothetical protein
MDDLVHRGLTIGRQRLVEGGELACNRRRHEQRVNGSAYREMLSTIPPQSWRCSRRVLGRTKDPAWIDVRRLCGHPHGKEGNGDSGKGAYRTHHLAIANHREETDRRGRNPVTMMRWRRTMAIRMTRSAGMVLLAMWLILTGIGGFAAFPIPGVLMAALALIAGILILIGM